MIVLEVVASCQWQTESLDEAFRVLLLFSLSRHGKGEGKEHICDRMIVAVELQSQLDGYNFCAAVFYFGPHGTLLFAPNWCAGVDR